MAKWRRSTHPAAYNCCTCCSQHGSAEVTAEGPLNPLQQRAVNNSEQKRSPSCAARRQRGAEPTTAPLSPDQRQRFACSQSSAKLHRPPQRPCAFDPHALPQYAEATSLSRTSFTRTSSEASCRTHGQMTARPTFWACIRARH